VDFEDKVALAEAVASEETLEKEVDV